MMSILKMSAALALSGALVGATGVRSCANRGRRAAAAGIGFAAGTIAGAAAANSGYYGPAYGYAPGYTYGPFAGPGYAGPTYYGSNYNYNPYQCRVDEGYGRTSSCNVQ
jgi:hypothetical protein